MASPLPSAPVPASTPVPKSYAKGVAMTPDPWEVCGSLDYGADRSLAWSVNQQVVQTAPAGHAKLEAQLLAALAARDCTAAGRAFLCELLALVGSAKSAAALTPLLRDPKTADAARYALEAIPGPEVDAVLRDALGALTGDAKAGLIGSLAARGDRAASPALTALKDNPAEPAVVRDAAARALEFLAAS
ncbi:MAG: hypothetical protein NTV51_06800 [Verrucomicrobia bacterium]|nr:hypothetical protein [Verrucomicrobiota bacterium]